ncbi:28656_t:CDS:1, partial [Racocetra persica]
TTQYENTEECSIQDNNNLKILWHDLDEIHEITEKIFNEAEVLNKT